MLRIPAQVTVNPYKSNTPFYPRVYKRADNCVEYINDMFRHMRRQDVPYSKATAHLTDTASYDTSLHAIVTRAQRELPSLFQSTEPNTVGTLVHLIHWFVITFRDDPSTTENALITEIDQLRFPMADQHLLVDYQNILSLLSNKLDGLIKSAHVTDDYRTMQLYKLIDTIPVSVTNKRPLLSVEVEKHVQMTLKANPSDKRGRYAIAIARVEELGREDETLYAQMQHQLNLQQPLPDKTRHRPTRDHRYEARTASTAPIVTFDSPMDDYNAQLDFYSHAAGVADHCTCCGSTDCNGRTDLRSCNFIWLYVYDQKKRVALSFDKLKDLEPSVRSLVLQSAQTKGCLQNKTDENIAFFMDALNKVVASTKTNTNNYPQQPTNYDRNHDRNHHGGRGNPTNNQPPNQRRNYESDRPNNGQPPNPRRNNGGYESDRGNPNYHGNNYNPNHNANNNQPQNPRRNNGGGSDQNFRPTRTDNPTTKPLPIQSVFPTTITTTSTIPIHTSIQQPRGNLLPTATA